ncbi:hypothetical protein HBI82_060010 [Parastagonospora nodorum]|nr:hypothetical protein HBH54_187890 [Parastagonospora nodorum]KAH4052054.1 hypothetical protein HBH49_111440 [Parastagonospora nodorum]KAH4126678.1 hypothetical protein HBH47_050020 [Parastagonospora nodorum]KAH4151326.1 hypothetical protein HBH44_169930 [Parastagonospora nodorum]KAH4223711.1 hypothetical protein HBI06_128820 [Parastagonospora nodorum]
MLRHGPIDKPQKPWICMACVQTKDPSQKFQLNDTYFCKSCTGRWGVKNDPNHIEYMLCRRTLRDAENKLILDHENRPTKCRHKNAVANATCLACTARLPNKDFGTHLSSQTPVLLLYKGAADTPWFCATCGVLNSVGKLKCHDECGVLRESGLKVFSVPSTLDATA